MNASIAKHDDRPGADPSARLDELSTLAEDVLRRCRERGASQAEVGLDEDAGLSANVRMGEVETIEYNRDRGLSLTVYFGQRKGSASTADLDPASIALTIEQACAIARFTEQDPCAGLADAAPMARELPDLDLWHPRELDADQAVSLALRAEAAGRALDKRLGNSDGASTGLSSGIAVYANSHGFTGREQGTSYSISCSLIAGQGDAMQRDHWYDGGCRFEDLADPESIGRRAGERALARLSPRSVKTGSYPVLFAAEVARSLFGHLLSAVSGSALYREASFLIDHLGKPVMAPGIDVIERPHLRRGHRSAAFDNEGVATFDNPLVQDGVLRRYVLSSYSARKLGLATTANAGGVHNIEVRTGSADQAALIRGMGRGLLVTELMGQGVNLISGDYSRGAAGFWIENGEIAWPVDEVTIAGNLREMLLGIQAIGCDIDRRSATAVGSTLIGAMTVAGQ